LYLKHRKSCRVLTSPTTKVLYAAVLFTVIILSTGTRSSSLSCAKNEDTTDLPRPYVSAHSPSWCPDDSRIIFAYTPLKKINDTTYTPLTDSSGWWFINPNGSNLSYFLYASCGDFDWHPNGEEMIAGIGWGTPYIIKVNVNDTSITQLGYFEEGAFTARYSSDGNKIMVTADNGISAGLWIMDADGGNARFLISSSIVWARFDWSPDGHTVAYEDIDGGISLIDTNGTNIRQLTEGGGLRSSPAFSPDGTKLVFDIREDEFKDYEIYTINLAGSGLKKLATGRYPAWSPDGSEIVFAKFSYWGKYDEGNSQLWVMDSVGANQRQLTFVR